jgi:hypothetical protein
MNGLNSSGSELDREVGSCEHDDKSLGSVQGREFLDWLSDY